MSAREANFTHAIDVAERGEPVTITKNGKPVAELGPPKLEKKGFDWARAEQVRKELGLDTIEGPVDEGSWLKDDTDAATNRALLGIEEDWRPDLG